MDVGGAKVLMDPVGSCFTSAVGETVVFDPRYQFGARSSSGFRAGCARILTESHTMLRGARVLIDGRTATVGFKVTKPTFCPHLFRLHACAGPRR